MIAAIAALIPIFVLILLGTGMRRLRFLPDAFWAPAEKLTYYVTFPALLVANLADARVEGLPWGQLAGLLAFTTLVAATGLVGMRRFLPQVDGPAFSSMLQGTIRPNTYIGLAAAASLWGAEGVTLTAICIAAVVPLVNLLSVAGLVHWTASQRPNPARLVRPIVSNPLILACLIGIAINLSDLTLPIGVGPTLKILGSAALPVGLLAVGAGLNFSALAQAGLPVFVSSVFKLVLLPLLTGLGALAMGLPPVGIGVVTLYAALPCSASAYVLARQMGGDSDLMAAIISAQTLLAIATIPVAILLLGL